MLSARLTVAVANTPHLSRVALARIEMMELSVFYDAMSRLYPLDLPLRGCADLTSCAAYAGSCAAILAKQSLHLAILPR